MTSAKITSGIALLNQIYSDTYAADDFQFGNAIQLKSIKKLNIGEIY